MQIINLEEFRKRTYEVSIGDTIYWDEFIEEITIESKVLGIFYVGENPENRPTSVKSIKLEEKHLYWLKLDDNSEISGSLIVSKKSKIKKEI